MFRAHLSSFRAGSQLRRKKTNASLNTWLVVHLVRHDRFCLRLPGQLARRIIDGDSAEMAQCADYSPAQVCLLGSGRSDSARASTPLNWLANVAFCPPARVSPRGEDAMRMLPKRPPAQCPLRLLFSRATGSTPAKQKRSRLFRNSIVAQLLCCAWSPFRLSEKTRLGTDRRSLARHGAALRSSEALCRCAQLRRINNQSDAAKVARGRIGSP